jgi:hypothetical protein
MLFTPVSFQELLHAVGFELFVHFTSTLVTSKPLNSHRVKVHVAIDHQAVRSAIMQDRLESTLKQRTHPPVLRLYQML